MKHKTWGYLTGLLGCALLLASCHSPKNTHSSTNTGTMQIVDAQHCANVSRQRPFLLVLKRDDDFMQSLESCAAEAKLPAAVVSGGVGALSDPVVAYFDFKDKEYKQKKLNGNYELLAANGNLTWIGKKPLPHIHVTLGDANYKVYGGHLMSATVAVVAEIMITPLQTKATRSENANLQLKTIDVNK